VRYPAHHDPATKQYLTRKEAEDKTTKGALRCLKRHLARRIHQPLAEQPAGQPSPQPPCPQRNVDPNITGVARFSMSCAR
jgi:hypothetical protein